MENQVACTFPHMYSYIFVEKQLMSEKSLNSFKDNLKTAFQRLKIGLKTNRISGKVKRR